jgi:hypothetical protein
MLQAERADSAGDSDELMQLLKKAIRKEFLRAGVRRAADVSWRKEGA